jgi:hypothetical protein
MGAGLRRVFGKAVDRDQARLSSLSHPRQYGIDVLRALGSRRSAGPRQRHAPAHSVISPSPSALPHGRRIIGEDAGHRRHVADVAVHDTEERNGGLASHD